MQRANDSPFDLRQHDAELLDTYHPGDGQPNTRPENHTATKSNVKRKGGKLRWLPRLVTNQRSHSDRDEASGDESRQETSKVQGSTELAAHYGYSSWERGHRLGQPMDERDELDDEEDDDDRFDEPPLTIPYTSSSMQRSTIVRQQTDAGVVAYGSSGLRAASLTQHNNIDRLLADDEFLMDDRQGMNSAGEQFTKGEQMDQRRSFDGSFISDSEQLAGAEGSTQASGKPGGSKVGAGSRGLDKNSKTRQSKGSSSSSPVNFRRQRHSRRGIVGLASRLKLTRKHEPIAKLQLSIFNSGLVSLKCLDRDLATFLPKERMSPKELEQRVKLMRKYEILIQIEYKFASRYETYVCRHATHESNQPKNNYKKCIPYDYNRVILKTLPNVPHGDYINASHIDSCLKPNAYIAAQGPNENTIDDFWRMIWEQKSFVVVMLTKVFDFIRSMCNQYWPVECNKPERYGQLEVTLLYEEPLADFVIRTIRLTKLRGSQQQAGKHTNDELAKVTQSAAHSEEQPSERNTTDGFADDYDDEDDDFLSDDTISDAAEPLEAKPGGVAGSSANQLAVRSPKFVRRNRSPERRRRKSGRQEGELKQRDAFDFSESRRRRLLEAPQLDQRSASQPPPASHLSVGVPSPGPLGAFSTSSLYGGGLLSGTLGSAPGTPLTPSTAGIDRSSATRRAVKKKRRARVKSSRPTSTQFQVPLESQLLDDDDDDDEQYATDVADEGPAQEAAEGSSSNSRIIYQFHYNSWASHTCPFINSLLHFRRRVRICMDEMSKSGKTGPAVVHCNDGCGRTGTYLCIDANLELAEEDNVFEIFNYTKKMRQSRKLLIENLEQYRFVYDTIEEALFCGKTWFPVAELHKRLKHKSQRNPLTKKNEYQREYEKITRMTSKFSIGDCAGGHRVENREKNRDVSTVPPDNFRPYLSSFQTNDNTDYINAVFVDGYTRSKEYIVTEWPSHKTISDFWSLIYDHDCNSVILLANPGESSTYPSFLPSEKELRRKFGPVFSAEMVSYTHYQNIKSWIYTINKKIVSLTEVIAGVKSETKTTQVFQITCWPQGHRVPTSTNALVELMNMVERWRQRTTYGPVCVVSLDGKSRAGVYCAANVAIEQVVQHSEVDVFQAVKTVRRHRPQLIENMTEYKYCYDLILHYVLHYVNQPHAK